MKPKDSDLAPSRSVAGWEQREQLRTEVLMFVRELPIAIDQETLAAFCQERGIRKLSLFGSALRSDFTPTSDVDLLVEYWPHCFPGWDLFLHEYELTQLVGKEVDLNLPTMLSPYFREEVLAEAVTLYEQT
jgi:uncharacterized protein